MTLKYLMERAQDQGAVDCEIYMGNVAETRDLFPVFTVREPQDMLTNLDKFGRNFFGTFTAILRTRKHQEKKSGERIVFVNMRSDELQQMQPPLPNMINGHMLPAKSEEQIRNEIVAELTAKNELQLLKEQMQYMQQQHALNGMLENRLGNVLTTLGSNLGWWKGPATTPINGPTPTPGTPGQPNTHNTMNELNYGPHDAAKLNEAEAEQLDVLCEQIYSHLGMDTMQKVAAALSRDPSLANKLVLFI
jgi:hypothetical protein